MPWSLGKEQGVTIPVPGESRVLEGLWQASPGPGGAVIAPPHPLYGGSMSHPVVHEIAYAMHRRGVPSLRFNWRGVGASPGEPTGDVEVALADFRAAAEHVARTVEGPTLMAGYSFGAALALRHAPQDRRVRGVLLVAPPVRMLESLDLEAWQGPLLVIVGSRDPYAPPEALFGLLRRLAAAELRVIDGADHFFGEALGSLAEVLDVAWLQRST